MIVLDGYLLCSSSSFSIHLYLSFLISYVLFPSTVFKFRPQKKKHKADFAQNQAQMKDELKLKDLGIYPSIRLSSSIWSSPIELKWTSFSWYKYLSDDETPPEVVPLNIEDTRLYLESLTSNSTTNNSNLPDQNVSKELLIYIGNVVFEI